MVVEERPLAEYVRRLREGKYMSQGSLSRATGLSRNYVKAIEDGFSEDPSAHTVGLLLVALDSNVVEIMDAVGRLSPDPANLRFEMTSSSPSISADEEV